MAGNGRGTAAHAHAALVHQVVGLHAVLQMRRGATRCRLRAVVHTKKDAEAMLIYLSYL